MAAMAVPAELAVPPEPAAGTMISAGGVFRDPADRPIAVEETATAVIIWTRPKTATQAQPASQGKPVRRG
jgi:hypothetical protein